MTSQVKKLLSYETTEFLREDRVLVYHYRANGSPIVKDGLAVITRKELEDILRTRAFKPLSPLTHQFFSLLLLID